MSSRDGWERCGFFLEGEKRWQGFRAKPGSHDDGDFHGPFLGGIGTGSFSRDIYGRFSRWNLQPGCHLHEVIPQAQLLCQYSDVCGAERAGVRPAATRFIGVGTPPSWEGYTPSFGGFPEETRDYAALFPRVRERYSDPDFPLELNLDSWSPLVFGDYEASSLPVVFFSVNVVNRTKQELWSDFALFWPNLLGWRAPMRTTTDLGGRAWPGHGHSGNSNRPFYGGLSASAQMAGAYHEVRGSPGGASEGIGVLQERNPHLPVARDMEGQVAVSVLGPRNGRYSIQACMKADQNALGIPAKEQLYTQAWAQEYFVGHGLLPGAEETWTAHWHEALSSAVHGGVRLSPGERTQLHFSLVWDMPLVLFGDGRRWEKQYTSRFGVDGRNAEKITRFAFDYREEWWSRIEAQTSELISNPDHDARLVSSSNSSREKSEANRGEGVLPSDRVSAAMLNELFFLTGGGSVWTAKEHGTDTDAGLTKPEDVPGRASGPAVASFPEPRLGGGEHFALLEGYDNGYYYYSTIDLWVYAFPAFARTWPRLADLVFDDYLKSAAVSDPTPRIVYREMEEKQILRKNALPHDLGNPMEDPWHRLNGYTMRDDPNVWKDRSPSFIISTYLHRRICGRTIDRWEYEILMGIGRTILDSGSLCKGVPLHSEFGDNTWDALQLRGYSSYSGGLSIASYAALASLARSYGDESAAEEYDEYFRSGKELLETQLWNGKFYQTDSAGRYSNCVMTGSLIGPFYASLAGLGPLLPVERIVLHLKSVFAYNFLGYMEGEVGPLLVNNETSSRFYPDGGEELQINEVIVGSAWLYCGMLAHFGLHEEARRVGESMQKLQYERAGLQFRTPAAWDGENRFRAPLNMRPLAVWWNMV